MATFLNSAAVSVNEAGYLVVAGTTTPIYNKEFLEAQEQAAYVVELAKAVKGKDFVGKKADKVEDVLIEVVNKLNKEKVEQFVEVPKTPTRELTDKLKQEALTFLDTQKNQADAEKINNYMQRFTVLKDFEQFGLYFEERIVKLNKIHTVAEIVEAVKQIIHMVK
jgi:hypothetical protein